MELSLTALFDNEGIDPDQSSPLSLGVPHPLEHHSFPPDEALWLSPAEERRARGSSASAAEAASELPLTGAEARRAEGLRSATFARALRGDAFDSDEVGEVVSDFDLDDTRGPPVSTRIALARPLTQHSSSGRSRVFDPALPGRAVSPMEFPPSPPAAPQSVAPIKRPRAKGIPAPQSVAPIKRPRAKGIRHRVSNLYDQPAQEQAPAAAAEDVEESPVSDERQPSPASLQFSSDEEPSPSRYLARGLREEDGSRDLREQGGRRDPSPDDMEVEDWADRPLSQQHGGGGYSDDQRDEAPPVQDEAPPVPKPRRKLPSFVTREKAVGSQPNPAGLFKPGNRAIKRKPDRSEKAQAKRDAWQQRQSDKRRIAAEARALSSSEEEPEERPLKRKRWSILHPKRSYRRQQRARAPSAAGEEQKGTQSDGDNTDQEANAEPQQKMPATKRTKKAMPATKRTKKAMPNLFETSGDPATDLRVKGVCVIDTWLSRDGQAASGAAIDRVLAEAKKFPEYKTQPVGSKYVSGAFAALGNPASFHCPFVREARLRALSSAVPELFDSYMRTLSTDHNLEQLPDRLVIRPARAQVTAETWHRDQAKGMQAGDQVFGGWINLDRTPQYFSCVPGTHKTESRKRGFVLESPDVVKALGDQKRLVRVQPGQMIVFVEDILHEVNSSVQAHVSCRLFLGWRITTSKLSLTKELRQRLDDQAVLPMKSGQFPPMYSKNNRSLGLPALITWSNIFVDQVRERTKGKSGVYKGENLHLVSKSMPSLREAGLKMYPKYAPYEYEALTPRREWKLGEFGKVHLKKGLGSPDDFGDDDQGDGDDDEGFGVAEQWDVSLDDEGVSDDDQGVGDDDQGADKPPPEKVSAAPYEATQEYEPRPSEPPPRPALMFDELSDAPSVGEDSEYSYELSYKLSPEHQPLPAPVGAESEEERKHDEGDGDYSYDSMEVGAESEEERKHDEGDGGGGDNWWGAVGHKWLRR